jgi:hypothetical protein
LYTSSKVIPGFTAGTAGGKGHIELTVDKGKFHADEKKAQEKLHSVNPVKGKDTGSTATSKDKAAPPVSSSQD